MTYRHGGRRILQQLHVRKQYSQSYFITINYVEFHSYILISFFKLDRMDAGRSPIKGSRMSNSKGIGGILT
jgi:hypothetical protein